jgi:hypothetical protein
MERASCRDKYPHCCCGVLRVSDPDGTSQVASGGRPQHQGRLWLARDTNGPLLRSCMKRGMSGTPQMRRLGLHSLGCTLGSVRAVKTPHTKDQAMPCLSTALATCHACLIKQSARQYILQSTCIKSEVRTVQHALNLVTCGLHDINLGVCVCMCVSQSRLVQCLAKLMKGSKNVDLLVQMPGHPIPAPARPETARVLESSRHATNKSKSL